MDMRSWITYKVRSERGASLSMALLVALVCTVVASVVLSAATAVSGRQSQLEEMERSYYNVTSAARLFWDEMSNDSQGLAVRITRGCNAQKSGSDWEGWYLQIDSSARTAVGGVDSADTLFQIASYDLVMNKNGSLDFKVSRPIGDDGETIKSSFVLTGSVPVPLAASQAKASYESFAFKAKKGTDELKEVKVKVTRNDDQTYDFEFREENDTSYICTLTALVWATGGEMRLTDDSTRLEGTTQVNWRPINMTVGTVGDAS